MALAGKALRDWPPRYAGRPGQGPLRKFSAMTWLRAVPGFEAQLKSEVPPEFLAAEEQEDGTRVVTIACPCGAEPVVSDNGTRICEGEDCGRVFLMLGERVWVARYDPADLSNEREDDLVTAPGEE